MKTIKIFLLTILYISLSFVSSFAKNEVYDLNYVLQLKGGFPYTIEQYAKDVENLDI